MINFQFTLDNNIQARSSLIQAAAANVGNAKQSSRSAGIDKCPGGSGVPANQCLDWGRQYGATQFKNTKDYPQTDWDGYPCGCFLDDQKEYAGSFF